MMENMKKWFSPKSAYGPVVLSVLAHVVISATVVIGLKLDFFSRSEPVAEEYVDLGYETFDQPPAPAEEVKSVRRSEATPTPPDVKETPDDTPKELQDEKSDIAGTQKASKPDAAPGSDNNGTAASTPYYRIKPKYPKAALIAGTEGWVMLEIDINEKGEVENVRVVDGEQRNMFQNEAKRAVALWKYRPFVDTSGNPMRKQDYQVRVDFKLNEASEGDAQ